MCVTETLGADHALRVRMQWLSVVRSNRYNWEVVNILILELHALQLQLYVPVCFRGKIPNPTQELSAKYAPTTSRHHLPTPRNEGKNVEYCKIN